MDRGMDNSLSTKKVDRSNYGSWSYKMHQYLLGHGYWSYVDGANDAIPESTHKDFLTWEQVASRVLYCFTSCVSDKLLSYIRDTRNLKNTWHTWGFLVASHMCMCRRSSGGVRRKLDTKAKKCILVSYSDEQKGYKCYNPQTKQARVSRDVVFDESASW